MKKLLAGLLAASLVFSLVGCGGAASSGAAGGSTEGAQSSKDKTVINFWHCMGAANGDRIQGMVDRFNASHPDVEVIATHQGSYEEGNAKLQTAIAANTAPDIAQLERAFIEPYATANRLANLNPFLEKEGMTKDDFVTGLMGYSYYNDSDAMVSVPFARSTPIFYYNKTAFEAAGLDPEKGPETWTDLKEYANKLTIKDGDKTTQFGLTWPIATWYFKANVAQLGSRTINEDKTAIGFYEDGTGVEVLKYWAELKDSGVFKVVPVKDGANLARQAFINGEVAMFQESTSLIGVLVENTEETFEIGASFIPYQGERAMPTGGANIVMLESSANKDAAWVFVEWVLNNPDGGLQFVLESGYLPYTKSMVESEAIQKLWAEQPMYKVAYDQLDFAVDTEQHLHWSELKAAILDMEQAVINDGKNPQEEMDKLYQKSKDILGQ